MCFFMSLTGTEDGIKGAKSPYGYALCRNNTTTLVYPVGHWQRSFRERLDTWQCFTSEDGEELYIKHHQTDKRR